MEVRNSSTESHNNLGDPTARLNGSSNTQNIINAKKTR